MTASRGIGSHPSGEDHPRAVLTVAKVQEMRRRAASGQTYEAISTWAGCSRSAVRDAVIGVTWPDVTDPPPLRRHRRWTAAEIAALATRGEHVNATLAANLGRTPHAIRQQRSKRGLARSAAAGVAGAHLWTG